MFKFKSTGRRFTFVCATCGRTARARELALGLEMWTPRCPQGHGDMKRAKVRRKYPHRKRVQP